MPASKTRSSRSSSRRNKKRPPARWVRLFDKHLPGYDPIGTAAKGDWFDAKAADAAVLFFHVHLQFIEGSTAGQPFKLEPWQQAYIGCLFGWKRANGNRRYTESLLYVPRKNGKALALDTPIPTPAGWTTMGELECGDTIFDENGNQTKVLEAHNVMHGNPCMRVSFSDGTSIVADEEHLWTVFDRRRAKFVTVTTKTIADNLEVGNRETHKERRYRLPDCAPLECSEASLSFDPYVLGYWLGDGDSDCARLTISDHDVEDVVGELEACGYRCGPLQNQPNGAIRCPIGTVGTRGPQAPHSLTARFRRAGLLQNKHIPKRFLRGSFSQRLSLLQGLMDSDGHCTKNGQCEFTTTNARLADGVNELIRSLGLKVSMQIKEATINGRSCGPKYRIQFFAYQDTPVFRLERKRERQKPVPSKRTRAFSRTIVACESVASVPVRCIRVDSTSSLFLAGEGMVATHNTPLVAGVVLLVMFTDFEPGAQIYSAAAAREQAAMTFRHCSGMIARNQELASRTRVYKTYKSIEYNSDGFNAIYRALASEAENLHGLNCQLNVIDEVHAHKNRDLIDVLQSGTASREQPLTLYVTTADFDRPSPCNQVYNRAVDIRDGVIDDPSFLPCIFEATIEDDWTDEKVWAKANPNLGVSVKIDYLRQGCKKAKETPSYENTFKRLHLNIRTEQADRWLQLHKWDECQVEEVDFEGLPVYVGIDLASKLDTTAMVFVARREDGTFLIKPYFFLPKARAAKGETEDRGSYREWAADGHLMLTEGGGDGQITDYRAMIDKLQEVAETCSVQEVGVDPYNATQVMQDLDDLGYTVVEVRQGYPSLNDACKEFEAAIVAGKLEHDGNPMMRWMVSNVAKDEDSSGNIKPSKKKSTNKIDGVAGAVTAITRVLQGNEEDESIYESDATIC